MWILIKEVLDIFAAVVRPQNSCSERVSPGGLLPGADAGFLRRVVEEVVLLVGVAVQVVQLRLVLLAEGEFPAVVRDDGPTGAGEDLDLLRRGAFKERLAGLRAFPLSWKKLGIGCP